MNNNKQFEVSLAIAADEYLKLYRGVASEVIAHADGGARIRFPANALKPFVTHAGVYGRFVISVDQNNRLQSVKRVNST